MRCAVVGSLSAHADGASLDVIAHSRFAALSTLPFECVVVVLAPSALAELDDERTERALDTYGGRVLMPLPHQRRLSVLTRAHSLGIEVIDPQALSGAITDSMRNLPLQRLGSATWLQRCWHSLSSRDKAALRWIARVERLSVGEWLGAAAISRRVARGVVHRALGVRPRRAMLEYRVRAATRMIEAGISTDTAAVAVSYSGREALARARSLLREDAALADGLGAA